MLARHPQVTDHLGLKDGIDVFHTLDFHDDCVLHEEIDPVFSNLRTLVDDWVDDLSLKAQTRRTQFHTEGGLISAFQQSGPEMLVNFDGTTDDLFREIFRSSVPLCLCGYVLSFISFTKSSNKYNESCGPGAASGWYCTQKTGSER